MQQQFNVDESHRRYILSAMSKSWRNYKSVLTRRIRALAKNNDVTRKLKALKGLKPRNIKSKQQWQRFIKERISAEFKVSLFSKLIYKYCFLLIYKNSFINLTYLLTIVKE